MKYYTFEIVVEKEAEDEGYMAYSPTLPGCCSNRRKTYRGCQAQYPRGDPATPPISSGARAGRSSERETGARRRVDGRGALKWGECRRSRRKTSFASSNPTGFKEDRQSGSHLTLSVHEERKVSVTIPVHTGCDVGRGLAVRILKDAGFSVEDYLRK